MLNSAHFVKVNEEIVINTEWIRWIKTRGKCFSICSKLNGCSKNDTHIVCKTDNPDL